VNVNGPSGPSLTLRLDPWLYIAVCLAVFAGFQGGRYYLANRLQELGIACALLLFAVGAWRALFRLGQREWLCWTGLPVLLIGGIMGISSLVFTMNYEGRFLYSVFSAREFLLAFLGPGIYLLCRCGLPQGAVERCLWVSFVALMLNYLLFYFTMDLRAAFFSSDHTVSNLVTYDAWRGFRLKPPLFAIMVALLASLALLRSAGGGVRIGALLTIGLAAWIWSIVLFRSTLATMLLSVLIYPLLLSHRNRVSLIIVLAPLGLIAAPIVAGIAVDNFLGADGGSIRAKAFAQAFAHIPQHPLFGAGEDSAYGDSYQDIVAPYFFPSDLGLVGVTYKYGIAGVLLYLFMHGRIWLRLWQANIAVRETTGAGSPLLWGFLIFMTAQTFNLALNPGLAYAQGITAGTVALALACLAIRDARSRREAPGLAPRGNRTILGAGAAYAH
jgi:hypothetical protein